MTNVTVTPAPEWDIAAITYDTDLADARKEFEHRGYVVNDIKYGERHLNCMQARRAVINMAHDGQVSYYEYSGGYDGLSNCTICLLKGEWGGKYEGSPNAPGKDPYFARAQHGE